MEILSESTYKDSEQLSNRFLNIHQSMLDIMSFEDIWATILYRIDGTVIKAELTTEIPSFLLYLLGWIKNVITKVSNELSTDIDKITYTKNAGNQQFLIIFYKIGNTGILATIVDAFTNSALLSIEIERLTRKIQEQLEIPFLS